MHAGKAPLAHGYRNARLPRGRGGGLLVAQFVPQATGDQIASYAGLAGDCAARKRTGRSQEGRPQRWQSPPQRCKRSEALRNSQHVGSGLRARQGLQARGFASGSRVAASWCSDSSLEALSQILRDDLYGLRHEGDDSVLCQFTAAVFPIAACAWACATYLQLLHSADCICNHGWTLQDRFAANGGRCVRQSVPCASGEPPLYRAALRFDQNIGVTLGRAVRCAERSLSPPPPASPEPPPPEPLMHAAEHSRGALCWHPWHCRGSVHASACFAVATCFLTTSHGSPPPLLPTPCRRRRQRH